MTDQDIMDIGGLVHQRWVQAFKNLEVVNNDQPTGEKDWMDFHITQLEYAEQDEAQWSGIKQRFMEENRAVYKKMLEGI